MGRRFGRGIAARRAAPSSYGPSGARARDPEAQLLLRIAENRDEAALIALYESISAAVYACCLRILRDADEAKDATSEAFWRLWTRADRYDPERCSAMAWIMFVLLVVCTLLLFRSSRHWVYYSSS